MGLRRTKSLKQQKKPLTKQTYSIKWVKTYSSHISDKGRYPKNIFLKTHTILQQKQTNK